MSSLTDTANTVKKLGVIGIIGFVIITVLVISVIAAVSIKNKYFPSKNDDVVLSQFGLIDKINFLSADQIDATKLSFQIETVSGDLGINPVNAKVYKLVVPAPSILDLENSKLVAEKMGFVSEPQLVEGSVYQWRDDGTGRTMTYNIVTKNFNIESSRIFSPEYISSPPPGNEEAIRIAKSWLSSNNLNKNDFEESKITATPIKVEVTQLKKALSLSEANYVQVNFKRKNIEDSPIIEPSEQGLISILVTGQRGREAVAQVNYKYSAIDEKSFSFYPLITSEQAFEKLKIGEGKIISSPVVSGTVFIRKTYIGYYLSDFDENYLQPVVVFDSLDGFLAVVPAVRDDQYKNEDQNLVR